MTDSDTHGYDGASSADRTVAMFRRIDGKVDAMRERRLNDPDSLGDKILKAALPALTGLVVGKIFSGAWNRGAARRNIRLGREADADQGLFMSLAFAAASAAIGAVASKLSDRGSQAWVSRRHRRRSGTR